MDIAATKKEMTALAAHTWWHELRAVKEGKVTLVDGNQMFSRPGPRLVDALEFLVALLHGQSQMMPPQFPCEPYQL